MPELRLGSVTGSPQIHAGRRSAACVRSSGANRTPTRHTGGAPVDLERLPTLRCRKSLKIGRPGRSRGCGQSCAELAAGCRSLLRWKASARGEIERYAIAAGACRTLVAKSGACRSGCLDRSRFVRVTGFLPTSRAPACVPSSSPSPSTPAASSPKPRCSTGSGATTYPPRRRTRCTASSPGFARRCPMG